MLVVLVVLVAKRVSRSPSASVKRNWAPGCGRSLRTISRIPFGQLWSTSPSSSATQAPSPTSPSGSVAAVQAEEAGTFRTAWWICSVGHADRVRQPPAAPGQPGHELVGAAAGVGPDQCLTPAPVLLRQLGQGELGGGDVVDCGVAARVAGRSRPATGSPVPFRPWSTKRRPDSLRRARPPGLHPAGSSPDRAPPAPCHGARAADITWSALSSGPFPPTGRLPPARPPPGHHPRRGHASRTRCASSPGKCLRRWQEQGPRRCGTQAAGRPCTLTA